MTKILCIHPKFYDNLRTLYYSASILIRNVEFLTQTSIATQNSNHK